MKALKIVSIALALLLTAAFVAAFIADDIEINISEDTAREQVEAALPVTVKRSGVTAVVDTIDLSFRADNKVDVVLGMDLSGFGLNGRSEGRAEAAVRYHQGAFYLEGVDMDDLKITPTAATTAKVNVLKATAGKVWENISKSDVFVDTPIADATFNDDIVKKLKPKAVTVANDTLKSVPVYRLDDKDMKLRLVGLALEKVTFTEDNMQITVSPAALAKKGLIWLFILTLAGILSIGVLSSATGSILK